MASSDFAEESDISRMVDRRMALTREWDALVEQVRKLPGFEDFLKPPPLEKLLPAAEHGPVAMINVSRWRCDALLVVDGGVRVRELPDLHAIEVEEKTRAYLTVLDMVSQRWRAWWQAKQGAGDLGQAEQELSAAEDRAEKMLRAILRWLWRAVAEPVLDELGFTATPDGDESTWPRLWWCPTGLLTMLPLHAAGDHLTDGTHRPTVLDRVVSSYTPTLRALMQAREPLPEDRTPELLIVTVPQVGDEPPLPEAAAERAMLQRRFPGRHRVLDGPEATVDEVARLLPTYRWAHLSCHGNQLLDDPSQGGLRLSDDVLTVARLSAEQHQGDFAFLSACKTATGGLGLADEAITLAAALHYTGYRHVIGTLWTVNSSVAAEVATAVYNPQDEPFDPAGSVFRLHTVLRRLRETERLSVWTPFIHLGP
ncbi:CHAT domain-containing protein [Verrucosispora sp. SN26_14.1]|uniref:CHAT domain-containing protein n=1 Tax=Verrucosispora sp. SN26_14.1 TaxID=2527879 RepID=UPI0013758C49|nr:CHAT domain-containing protein [Verrucosispora sp. SN26_14.1]